MIKAISSVAAITGGNGDDSLDGTGKADVLLGLGGDDVLRGLGGADSLAGGGGDDVLSGGSGADTLDGGGGADSMAGGSGDDLIYIDHVGKPTGSVSVFGDVVDGGSGFDTVSFAQCDRGVDVRLSGGEVTVGLTGVESIIGSAFGDHILASRAFHGVYDGAQGDDTLYSSHYHDVLVGGSGEDFLTGFGCLLQGGDGDDLLYGGSHATMDGGAGDDTFRFTEGNNLLTGGAGADIFRFEYPFGHDVNEIADLAAEDVIDLSAIDAQQHTAGDQAFVLVAHLDGHAGEAALRYDPGPDLTRLQLDTDGDAHADITLLLDGDQRSFDHFIL